MPNLNLQHQDSNFCNETIIEAEKLLNEEINMSNQETRSKVEEVIFGLVVCSRSSDESCDNETAFNTLADLITHTESNIEEYIWWKWIKSFRRQVQYIIDHKSLKNDKEAA